MSKEEDKIKHGTRMHRAWRAIKKQLGIIKKYLRKRKRNKKNKKNKLLALQQYRSSSDHMNGYGQQFGNQINRSSDLDNELKQMIKAMKDVLQETPPELASDIIDHGIIMTGGSSLLRNFADLVYRKTGVKATIAEDSLYCVAKGTGIALEHLDVYKKTILSKK